MSARSALNKLAEQIAVLSSEYRRLLKRCKQLEKEVSGKSGKFDKTVEPGSDVLSLVDKSVESMSSKTRKQVKAKLEEMLADLKDI